MSSSPRPYHSMSNDLHINAAANHNSEHSSILSRNTQPVQYGTVSNGNGPARNPSPPPPTASYADPHQTIHPWENAVRGGGQATYLPPPMLGPNESFEPLPNTAHSATLLPPGSVDGFASPRSPISPQPDLPDYVPPPISEHPKLGEWRATSICGNDITSSCFYVTGICVLNAGIYAPICMLMVAGTLYLFRAIYGESVTALPLNGGAYNVLLNTTSKSTAAIAACLTILSYMATGVVSAASAVAYLTNVPALQDVLSPLWIQIICVLALLGFFCLLSLWGITESADVALFIFTIHMCTLCILVSIVFVWCCVHKFEHFLTNVSDTYHGNNSVHPDPGSAIVFGFASAMLGVSGFESSANYVEEQAPGVFVKTLRNMWAAVAFFNPVIALLSICTHTIDELTSGTNYNITLSMLATRCGGPWLQYLVCIDAFLVLAGSVLTAFVGVTGLCRRLALDRCLPQFLLAENSWRKTNHFIIIGFLIICSSLYLILSSSGDPSSLQNLANVYTVSFLSVMSLFAIGNMLLKYKRGRLQREVRTTWFNVMLALLLVWFALVGTLINDLKILAVWSLYFICVSTFVAVMFFRVAALKMIYHCFRSCNKSLGHRRWFNDC